MREISKHSIYYFDPSNFDSLEVYSGLAAKKLFNLKTENVDSVCIIFKKGASNFMSYHQLCNSFHISKKGQKLGLGISQQSVKDLALMMFDMDSVIGVSVIISYNDVVFGPIVHIEERGIRGIEYKRRNVIAFERIQNEINKTTYRSFKL